MAYTKQEIKFFLKDKMRKVRRYFRKRPIISAVAKTAGSATAAAVVFCLVLLLFGVRYQRLDFGEGMTAVYFGTVRHGGPISGKMIYSDGTTARITSGGREVRNSDGSVFYGDFSSWRYSGYGELYLGDGSSYVGEFSAGVPHGDGKFTGTDGEIYAGSYQNGVIHGKGTYTYADGSVYSGDFSGGERSGSGVMVYPNGDVYIGDFVSGVREGHGLYIWSDGLSYEGAFENNLPCGDVPTPVG